MTWNDRGKDQMGIPSQHHPAMSMPDKAKAAAVLRDAGGSDALYRSMLHREGAASPVALT